MRSSVFCIQFVLAGQIGGYSMHIVCDKERAVSSVICLTPQDSFGEFDIFFSLDLQKVQEIIRKHHKTFQQLF